MSFLSRAQKAYDRGDTIRAVVTLIEGLKRDPDNAEALDLLLRLYGIEVDGMGLESDVVKIVELQPDADDLLSVLVDNARACGHERVADALLEFGDARGISYVPPESAAPDTSEEVERTDGQAAGLEVEQPRPNTRPPEDGDSSTNLEHHEAATPENSPIPDDWLADIDDLGERSVPVDDSVEHPGDTPHEVANVPEESIRAGVSEAEPTSNNRSQGSAPRTRRRRNVAPDEGGNRFRKRHLILAAVVMGLVVTGVFGWREVQRVSAEASVEAALATMAPHRVDETLATLDEVELKWGDTTSVHDRVDFVRTYVAWTEGESYEPTPLGKSPWASGSLAIAAAYGGDLEGAIEMTTRAERTDAAAVPSLLARAVVEEERQRWSVSDRAWANLSERDPDVLPAYEGRARNAWRRLDENQLGEALDALERRDEKHPYLVLRDLDEPFGTVNEGVVVRPVSKFLESVERFRLVRLAFARGDHRGAAEAAQRLSSRESSGIAALQLGVALAHDYQLEAAVAAFERAALTEGTTRELRLRIQAMAPEALTGIGRPDASERFETVLPGKTPREKMELRLPALRRSALESIRESEWATRAIFAHVDAVAQRGGVDEALELYAFLEGREVDAERARWEAELLKVEAERNVRAPSLEGEARAVWQAASDFLDGEFDRVNVLTTLPTDGALGTQARRYQIASLISSRRVAVALQLVEEERGTVSAAADGLRVRGFARQARANVRFENLYEKMTGVEPVGMRRLSDLAAAAFWQGKVDDATTFADAVLALEEGHREANWIKGLILRQQGEFSKAESYLRQSGRDWDDTAGLLIELGYVSLALENWDEARKSFYKAFLKNRESIEAVRGLGMAYAAVRSEVAVRDLSRIEEALPQNARFSPVRGEALRWLAVVEGVREGNTDALSYLEGAMKEVGKRPDLLVERARFHEARDQRAEARKLYAAALQGNTTLASAHLGLARTALQDGDESVARDHLERYLEVEPRGSGAQWARKRLASLNEDQ